MIVEDEFSIAMDIKLRLQKMGYTVTDMATHYEEALLKLAEQRPDVVLMDIHLSRDKSGIDTAEKVYKSFNLPVVFVTAFSDKATIAQAMAVMPFGYVIKPFKDVDLDNAITVAVKQHQALLAQQAEVNYLRTETKTADAPITTPAEPPHIFIKHKGQLEKIIIDDLIFLEALDNYTNVFTTAKKYTINTFLKDLHGQLPENKFLRVHRSYVVNVDAIQSIDDNMLYLRNNTSVPVSKSYRSEFLGRIRIIS